MRKCSHAQVREYERQSCMFAEQTVTRRCPAKQVNLTPPSSPSYLPAASPRISPHLPVSPMQVSLQLGAAFLQEFALSGKWKLRGPVQSADVPPTAAHRALPTPCTLHSVHC